jgi:hypothetical protein
MSERIFETLSSDPTQAGAVFENGRISATSYTWERFKEIVPVLDVKKEEDRRKWMLENIRVFSDGTLSNPHLKWKSIIDAHLSEIKVAGKSTNHQLEKEFKEKILEPSLSGEEKKEKFLKLQAEKEKINGEIKESEEKIKAMMAVSSSARAMEVSSGNFGTYALIMTAGDEKEPNLDKQDSWAEFLLHKDTKKVKIKRVLKDEMIKFFYERIMVEAGVKTELSEELKEEEKEKEKEEEERKKIEIPWFYQIDKEKAITSKLFLYLANNRPFKEEDVKEEDKDRVKRKNEEWIKKIKELYGQDWQKKTSLNDYIADVLMGEMSELDKEKYALKGYDDTTMWAAARLACDIFMVDKMTRWSHMLTKNVTIINREEGLLKIENDDDFNFNCKPTIGWGGDPLTSIIDPSFLPRVVKGVYTRTDEGKNILKKIDKAFRPIDLSSDKEGVIDLKSDVFEGIEGVLPCSMTASLKILARYNSAHYAFLGGSRAGGVSQWSKEVLENLTSVIENLDQVYGGIKGSGEDKNLGKEIMGAILARILKCKAQATALRFADPDFRGAMTTIFGDVKTRDPFYDVKTFLWGPHLDSRSGFLKDMTSDRAFVILHHNRFDAERNLKETRDLLTYLAVSPEARKAAKRNNIIGFGLEALSAFSEFKKK